MEIRPLEGVGCPEQLLLQLFVIELYPLNEGAEGENNSDNPQYGIKAG